LIVKPHLPLFPTAPKYVTNPLPPYKNMCFEATIIQETKMQVYVDKDHIRLRHLYVMPLASTFLDEESMNDCIRKALEWCEGLPLDDGSFKTHVFIWREGISHVFWRSGKEREVGFYNQVKSDR
jgi:hypothetical protein